MTTNMMFLIEASKISKIIRMLNKAYNAQMKVNEFGETAAALQRSADNVCKFRVAVGLTQYTS